MSLIRLISGNGLQLVGNLFRLANSIISIIVKEFCHMVRLNL
jgi:hypothetical protein